ncbi:hypothetical protein U9M48_043279 [Paspalum notatum var. saurae]|uniref:Uncharacterized protein n=1 Tax=Paspalum notatum var. saurae TaxID=547442 RepID=A0AAQ3XH65_PASNO
MGAPSPCSSSPQPSPCILAQEQQGPFLGEQQQASSSPPALARPPSKAPSPFSCLSALHTQQQLRSILPEHLSASPLLQLFPTAATSASPSNSMDAAPPASKQQADAHLLLLRSSPMAPLPSGVALPLHSRRHLLDLPPLVQLDAPATMAPSAPLISLDCSSSSSPWFALHCSCLAACQVFEDMPQQGSDGLPFHLDLCKLLPVLPASEEPQHQIKPGVALFQWRSSTMNLSALRTGCAFARHQVMAAKTTSSTPLLTMSECGASPRGVSLTRRQHVPASSLVLPQALGEHAFENLILSPVMPTFEPRNPYSVDVWQWSPMSLSLCTCLSGLRAVFSCRARFLCVVTIRH